MSLTYRRTLDETPGVNQVAQANEDVVTQLNAVPILDGKLLEDVPLTKTVSEGSGADLLYHFEDNLDDSSGNGNDGTAHYLEPYASSGAGSGGTGYGNATTLLQDWGTTDHSYIEFPNLDIGTGDLTVESWYKMSTYNSFNTVFYIDGFLLSFYGASHNQAYIANGASDVYYNIGQSWWNIGGGSPKWIHYAVTREDAGGGQSQVSFFFNGNKISPTTGTGLWAPIDIDDVGTIGKAASTPFSGNVDEFQITKSVKSMYSGSTYTIPSAPYASGGVLSRNQVRHGLGRSANGAIVVKQSGPANIRVIPSNSASELTVSTTAKVNASLWAF